MQNKNNVQTIVKALENGLKRLKNDFSKWDALAESLVIPKNCA
jgi:hypothetical protein